MSETSAKLQKKQLSRVRDPDLNGLFTEDTVIAIVRGHGATISSYLVPNTAKWRALVEAHLAETQGEDSE